jgi:hypothetical protein
MKKGHLSIVFFFLLALLLTGSFLEEQQQQRRPRVPWEERSPKAGKKVPDVMICDKDLNNIPLINLYKDSFLVIQWGGCTCPPRRPITSRKEALGKAFGHRGVSFYNVLSHEPHPGFYGFTQPDSLEMRQEYIRLTSAELQLDIAWIIDDMDNTLQNTLGRMPNMEFVTARAKAKIGQGEEKPQEWMLSGGISLLAGRGTEMLNY